MIHKEINLCGKSVTMGYCYATEIAFKDLSGQDMTDFAMETVTAFQKERMPDVKKTIYAILACVMAYYESKGEDAPVKDSELINETSPMEVGQALGTVLSLRAEFYAVPAGEPEEKPAKGKGKAKN